MCVKAMVLRYHGFFSNPAGCKIIGNYNKTGQTYTGQMDGWKVTRGVVAAALVIASIVVFVAGPIIFAVVMGGVVSAGALAGGVIFTLGGSASLCGLGVYTFPKGPSPSQSCLQHEKELREECLRRLQMA
jgi:hypothetical protein